jgi:hypothetical protein
MKQFLIFIGGMVAGALLLYAIGFRKESSVKEQLRRELIETLSHNFANPNQEAEIQYIEVKGKKGNVTLHTGMPKDSVQILVGKPDQVSLNTYGSSTHESWGYKINNKHGLPKEYQISDLDIDFVDGKLKNVRQD